MKRRAFIKYTEYGKIIPGSMIVTQGSFPSREGRAKWYEVSMNKCCTPSAPFDIQTFLSRMNSCYSQVTSLNPRLVYFSDRPQGSDSPFTNINDGCSDMYDGGNLYNTNLTQLYIDIEQDSVDHNLSIPYTHTQDLDNYECDYTNPPMNGFIVDGTNYFGAGSQYFTNMYPGMFILAADGINISEFSITGDIGTDGYATDAVYIATSHPGWTAFIKTNEDNDGGGDPPINQIILVYGNVSGVTQLYDDTGEYDDHCVQGLGSQNTTIITAVLATEPDTPALTKQEALAIANKILDVYNDSTCVITPAFRLLFSDNMSEVDAIVGDSSNVADWNSYFDLPAYGSPFTSVTVVGNEVKLYGGSNIIIKESLFDQADELGTYLLSVNDEAGCIIEAENNAFAAYYYYGCPNLISVFLPNLQLLGDECFYYLDSLQIVSLPLLEVIPYNCFAYCNSLTTINFPNVKIVGEYAFYSCPSLQTIILPLTTIINSSSFDECNSLLNVSIPELVTAGAGSFHNCSLITNLSFPKLETVDFGCFSDCSSLATINISNLTYCSGNVFANCVSLTEINIPLVTALGYAAFSYCTSLTNINLSSCTDFGGSPVNDNQIFSGIIGNNVTLTVPASQMTCNSGNPDGDIQTLQNNNTVTIITT